MPLPILPEIEKLQPFTPRRPVVPWSPRPVSRPTPAPRPVPAGMQRGGAPISIVPKPTQVPPITFPKPTREEPAGLPFWQRALQVFAAPFVWVDENIIEPGLALFGTTAGFVGEVTRNPGEDFWEWKKRSWAGWKAPGFNLNVPWSDDPWRIDIKGVLEIAPWLLIPGAGQVGGAISGLGKVGFKESLKAIGGAVAKGELRGAGRMALGTTITYSPWGLVEKTAGAAIKGGVRRISKATGKITEAPFGKIPEPIPPTPAIAKLTKYFKEAVMPARREFAKLKPEQVTSKQAQAIEKHYARARRGEISFAEANSLANVEMRGSLAEQFAFTPEALAKRQAKAIASVEARVVSGEISEATGKSLITKINKNPAYTAVPFGEKEVQEFLKEIDRAVENGFVKHESSTALKELFSQGTLPQPHNLRDWAMVFGDDFAKAVGKLGNVPITTMGRVVDVLNLPRAVLATADLSATFRQGLILNLVRPQDVPRSFWRQLKFFASEKLSLQMDDKLRSRPLYRTAVQDGVEFTSIRKGAVSAIKEEPFFSNLAQNLPIVRRSERAFTGYLNEMRMSAYEAAYGAMKAQGATAVEFKLMGNFINLASGRGTLPASLNKYAPLLNTVLFSPRYQMSTLGLPRQLGRMLLSKNPYMRKEAAKALITFVGGGTALLGLLKSTGAAKVEFDPRAGDFGKIVIGETRLDIWRGYVQYARFVAQMLTGESKSAYGNMSKKDRFDTAFRFLQGKSSPALGLMVDMLKGENYMGEKLFEGTTGATKMVRDRLLPLAIQDVMDAIEQSGANGIWTAIPATLGIGVLTYVNDLVRVQEKIARGMGYDVWDEIDPKTQREIENTNAELQAAQITMDRQVMGTAWGDWRLAGKAIEDVFRENVELAALQFRETGDGYVFKEKVSNAFTARRGGYDARNKEPRFEDIVKRLNIQDTVEADIALGPEQMAIRIYNDALWGDDMYDEFGDYRFDEADVRKEQVRRQLGNEMFNYVEEYRDVKYQDFPKEYQELAKARKILKPYWGVQEDANRYFTKDSPRWNAFISRHRKMIKLADRTGLIARYLDLFYSRNQ